MVKVEDGGMYRVGPHLLACGDLLVKGFFRSALAKFGQPVHVVYSDPPWSAGNLGFWRTHAGLPKKQHDWRQFIAAWADAVSACAPGSVYCEQSKADPDTVTEAMKAISLPHSGTWEVLYSSQKLVNIILRFSRHRWKGDPSGLAGEPVAAHVFDNEPLCKAGNGVADPCTGKGMTLRQAHRCGMAFLGTELNPKRLQITLDWICKKTRTEAVAC